MNKNLFDITSAASIGAAAEKLTKFSPLKKKGSSSSKSAAPKKAKAYVPKEPKVTITPAKPKVDPRTVGKEATHKRSADTGKVSKMTPKQKAAVDAFNSPRQFVKATPPKAVDLTDLE